jgi:hypothetical protein
LFEFTFTDKFILANFPLLDEAVTITAFHNAQKSLKAETAVLLWVHAGTENSE